MRPVKKTVEELKAELERLNQTFERRQKFLRARHEKELEKLILGHKKNTEIVKNRLSRVLAK